MADELGIGSLLARVLAGRGYTDAAAARAFLDASLATTEFRAEDICGLAAVADTLHASLARQEHILIFGDFDVDGLSATALLFLALRQLSAQASYIIPSRIDEGYGLTEKALTRVLAQQPDVVVTVDCGISADQEVGLLRSHGIEVLVTDHHQPGDAVPTGALVADPKLDPAGFGQELAGAGVALGLVKLLGQRCGQPELWRDYTDLASLGTIADMVPLTGINRALVKDGLERINSRSRPGFAALAAVQGSDQPASASDLSFGMIPRLNAAGRLGSAELSLEILIEEDPEAAAQMAERLQALNLERRRLEAELAKAAFASAEASYQPGQKLVTVAGEGWHEGIRGIIATRLARRYGVPAIVFSLVDGEARGSGRSVGRLNLFAALEQVSELTLRHGGHESAIGVTVSAERLEEFGSSLEAELAKEPEQSFHPPTLVDAQLDLAALDWDSVQELVLLEPCGQANPQPRFVSRPLGISRQRTVGNTGSHLSFQATDKSGSLPAIWFNCPDSADLMSYKGFLELAFEPLPELWRGQRSMRLRVTEAFPVQLQTALDEAFLATGQSLYPSQQQALSLLRDGHSPLCLLPTGRGKSLVFQMYAAELALAGQALSVFVYPLRALINDQQQQLAEQLHALGLESAILCGMSSPAERQAVYAALAAGRLSVILTTPEFLLLHAEHLAAYTDIAFIAIDEAHHAAAGPASLRPAYQRLYELRQLFPKAQVLAATATADAEAAAVISSVLSLDSQVVDDAQRTNLRIVDRRDQPGRLAALVELLQPGEPSVVYVQNRDAARFLVRDLRKALPEQAMRFAFYHAGLDRTLRQELEEGFRRGDIGCLVSTSAFGEGINLPGIRNLVVYHPPFSLSAFIQLAGRAGRDGRPAGIHLMFGPADLAENRAILAAALPEYGSLGDLFRYLRALIIAHGDLSLPDEVIAEAIGGTRPDLKLNARQVSLGLRIFEELGLLEVRPVGAQRYLSLSANQAKVELSSSSLYQEAYDELEEYEAYAGWLMQADPMALEELVQGAMLKGLAQSKEAGC